MTDWDTYGVCKCGFKRQAPFGKLFHIHLEVCPDCVAPKSTFGLYTMRWNQSQVTWWNPFTWDKGYWEFLNPDDKYEAYGAKKD